jgi:ribosome-associated toxin RatA of RatAB toxin-antitoxin module
MFHLRCRVSESVEFQLCHRPFEPTVDKWVFHELKQSSLSSLALDLAGETFIV